MSEDDGATGAREFFVGPIGPIPVVRHVDSATAAQRKEDAAVADSLHTTEQLQAGMFHERVGVRIRVVDRLVARGLDHPSTIPTLLKVLVSDSDPLARSTVAAALYRFGPDPRVVSALDHSMKADPDEDVRVDAMYSLDELGLLDA